MIYGLFSELSSVMSSPTSHTVENRITRHERSYNVHNLGAIYFMAIMRYGTTQKEIQFESPVLCLSGSRNRGQRQRMKSGPRRICHV